MFGFDEGKDHHEAVYGEKHEGKLSHELVGGAAAFEAMHLFENQQRKEGKTVKHGFAKEALAAFAGAEADKLIETKGLDYVDAEKAKHHAKQNAEQLYDSHYGDMDEYNPEARGRHSHTEW